jgi:hypothetical protein
MEDRLNNQGGLRRGIAALALLVAGGVALPARAGDDATAQSGGGALDPAFTLDPTLPQVGALPGGVTPAFGQRSLSEGEWRFDFHGFLTAPLSMGINSRPNPGLMPIPPSGIMVTPEPNPGPGQSKTVLHAPPIVPDDFETFSHTGVTPTTYAQLNFSEGNSIVAGNISIVARQPNASTTFLEPAAQLGITDVFISINPPFMNDRMHTQLYLGAFTARYGATGEYDEGRYGTPLIARISGVGELGKITTGSGKLTFVFEEGIHGQSNKASTSITPDVWNNFADPGEGSTFVGHLHAGVGYDRMLTLGAHYIHAFSQDDRAGTTQPDGRIDIYAGDVRVNAGRFGHAYAAFSYTDALQARPVSRVVSVMNTQGGLGLMDQYLGPNSGGTGTLTTIGGQYDLSVGRLVSYPVPFSGDGPDLVVSLFGIFTHVTSADKGTSVTTGEAFDGSSKLKYGVEATYSMLSWLAGSMRYDRVVPYTDNNDFSFAAVSPRLIFHTDWQATDQIVLQYTHWFYGSRTIVRTGDPPVESPLVVPDADVLSLSATIWW